MYSVLLYYCFTDLHEAEAYTEEHRAKCQELGLKGRVLIAREGINGTVCGLTSACEQYMQWLSQDPRFDGIEFKVDDASEHVFKKLIVKHRPEVITLGTELEQPVHQRTGTRLSPTEWHEMMGREDVVLLDGRNTYESSMGRFQGAICPPVEAFRDLPAWIEEHKSELEGKKVLTYCTGGIRCEKLTAWMLQAGFKHVYQLHGGIVNYAKDPQTRGEGFEGVNVVFDDRVAVPAGEKAAIVTVCRECGTSTANYVNCANVECNIRIVLCASCEAEVARTCSRECREAPRKRLKNLRLSESST